MYRGEGGGGHCGSGTLRAAQPFDAEAFDQARNGGRNEGNHLEARFKQGVIRSIVLDVDEYLKEGDASIPLMWGRREEGRDGQTDTGRRSMA